MKIYILRVYNSYSDVPVLEEFYTSAENVNKREEELLPQIEDDEQILIDDIEVE